MHPAARKTLNWALGLFAFHLFVQYGLEWVVLNAANSLDEMTDDLAGSLTTGMRIAGTASTYSGLVSAALVGATVVVNVLAPKQQVPEIAVTNPEGGRHFTG